ncbi:unnamed protein product [Cuscuta campestris]|uniref:Alpha-ketoglutarate-dependent dioxygenase AlkB-like domain-containing protein n=1 Tax=Cuscuta campestris TaxID=132261 RepID=A0A484LH38_9ASTE|nr:unnamed protein product [Cuscuta campestris]
MEELEVILREAFGESSGSEAEGELSGRKNSVSGPARGSIFSGSNRSWERITEINGLWICRDFLTSDQQSSLISDIQAEGWFAEESHNQAMRFGDLPEWAVELSNSIREAILFTNSGNSKEAIGLFPQDLLWREPLFDQLIANVYQPGEGICAHIDLMKFEDGIAIVSLESSCVMHFSRAESEEVCPGDNELHGSRSPSTKVPVLLTPGSMALMWGEARYLWKHEINRKQPLAVGFQEWQGRAITQQRRTSVTLRRLCLPD